MTQVSEIGIACEKKGAEFSVYLNLANNCVTPVWTFHKGVIGDLTMTETEDEEERLVRDPGQQIKEFITDRINLEISGTQVVNQYYEGCAFLNSARVGGTPVDVLVLDGPITAVGSAGWRGRWINPERTKEGPQTGGATQNFRLRPAACQVAACKVRPVIVATANAITDYNPQTFVPTVVPS